MLVLSRRENEKINLYLPSGDVIALTVVRVSRSAIRIGIDANPDVAILRGELDPKEQTARLAEGVVA